MPDQGGRGDLKKANSRVKARMDQRTRTQLPLWPALLRAVEQHRKDAEERLNTAMAAPAEGRLPMARSSSVVAMVSPAGSVP